MKRKILIAILSAIAALSAAFAAGCAVGPKIGDLAADRGATAHVIYNANGGEFETKLGVKDIFYKPDAPILDIGNIDLSGSKIDLNLKRITLTNIGYKFVGWYYPETDAEGNILYEDEAKTVVKLGEAVSFPYRIKDKETISVYAKWVPDKVVEIRLASDKPITAEVTVKGEDGVDKTEQKTFENGDIIDTRSFGIKNEIYIRDESPIDAVGFSFVSFYEDEACTRLFNGSVTKPEGTDDGNVVIYAKFIEGNWRIVKTKSNVTSMFNSGMGMSSYKYYIVKDIDCQGDSFNMAAATNCTIEGNGFKLYNLKFTATRISNGDYSPLGNISASAKISNLTLEDVTVSYSTMPNVTVNGLYLVCTGIADGATVNNLKLRNVKMEVSDAERRCTISNLTNADGGYFDNHWMFGGADTDEAFLAAHSGIAVENYSLAVNENVITENKTEV